MTLQEIIKNELAKCGEILIKYHCGTTPVNSEYIDINIGSSVYNRVNGDNLKPFTNELANAVDSFKSEFPNLHVITKKQEFHFYYPGFNSCSTKLVPISISNKDPKTEIVKTGIVTEKYQLVGRTKVLEVVNAHPDYELYERSGFGFRGAQERKCTLPELVKMLDWMCCADVEVIDNEIHVNGFSANDMY